MFQIGTKNGRIGWIFVWGHVTVIRTKKIVIFHLIIGELVTNTKNCTSIGEEFIKMMLDDN